MRRLAMLALASATSVVLLSGCGRNPGTHATGPQGTPDARASAGQKAFEKARTLYFQGNTNGAIDVLSAAMNDKACSDEKPVIFRGILELLLMSDRIQEAQARYLAALQTDERSAESTFGMIENFLRSKKDDKALLGWTSQLSGLSLPKGLQEKVSAAHLDANLSAGKFDVVLAMVPQVAKQFGAPASARMFGGVVSSLIGSGNDDQLGQILSAIRAVAGGSPELTDLVTCSEIRRLAARQAWDQAVERFTLDARGIQDSSLHACLASLASAAIGGGKFDAAEKVCAYVLKNLADKKNTWERAADISADVADKKSDPAGVAACFVDLRALNVPAEVVLRSYSRLFYKTMGQGSPQARASLMSTGDWLMSQLQDKNARDQVQAMLMDGAVLGDDYVRALKILKDGYRATEKEWYDMALNKVEAHLALQQGRKEEAVERFRRFMEHVKTWTETTTDPASGMIYTKEMSLGMNAKRIGDILASMEKKDDARKAYAEADQYFKEALAATQPDSKEAEFIKKEQAGLNAATAAK